MCIGWKKGTKKVFAYFSVERQRVDLRGREHGRPVRAQPDGARATEDLPGHQELHRRQARDGGGEREAGESLGTRRLGSKQASDGSSSPRGS